MKPDYGSVGVIELLEEAVCVCHPARPGLWAARGVRPIGSIVRVYWEFSPEELASAGDDASALPWGADRVVEVRRLTDSLSPEAARFWGLAPPGCIGAGD